MVAIKSILKRNFKGMGTYGLLCVVFIPFMVEFFREFVVENRTWRFGLIATLTFLLSFFLLEGLGRLMVSLVDILCYWVFKKSIFCLVRELKKAFYIKYYKEHLSSHGGRIDFLMKSSDWTVPVNVGYLLSKGVDAKSFLDINGYYVEKRLRKVGSKYHVEIYEKLKKVYVPKGVY